MEEMLITWRTGAPNGKELFGIITQRSIERGIWGGDSASPADITSQGHSGHSQVSKAQVLSELEFTLGQKERALQANPWDAAAQKHIEVLQQLRKLVETGVSQEELRQILNQLRSLTRTTSQVQPSPPSLAPPAAATYPYTNNRSYQGPYHGPPTAQSIPPYAHQSEPPKSFDISALIPATATSVTQPSPPANIASLYNALLKAGVVSASNTPNSPGSANHPQGRQTPELSTTDQHRDARQRYRKAVLSEKIKLTTTDILKKRSCVIDFLYTKLPVQCKQCGVRFGDDPCGKKQMDDHLDMHFKQNRGVGQSMGRGHSRSWFVGPEEWTREDAVDMKGKGRSDGSRSFGKKTVEVAQRDAELRAQFVVVPPGDEAKSISCPICKETMKAEFLEEDEEWVWRNAVKKDDRIYHATCHSEAVTSAHSLAARLRNDTSGRSRSRTPEVSAFRSTPPRSAGTGLRISLSPSPDAKRAMLKRSVHSTMLFANIPSHQLHSSALHEPPSLDATLKSIDDIANTDVEMLGPFSEQSIIIVVDTNILLEFLDVVQTFVAEVEQQALPVLLIIPGAVVYELDSQKNRDGLSWFARRASTWLLKKVKERKTVKGQALEETCKVSRNWKKREPGQVGSLLLITIIVMNTNAPTGIRCRAGQRQSYTRLLPVFHPHATAIRIIAHAIFGEEAARFRFSGYYPVYRNASMEVQEAPTQAPTPAPDDDGMDVDDDSAVAQTLRPSHALDLLHLQVVEYFTQLLLDLVAVVGREDVQMFGNGDVGSRHAPPYSRKQVMFWTASDCLEYLDSKKRCPKSSPRTDAFLMKPYEGRGARRGQDWSRRDWEVVLKTLAAIGEQWDAGSTIRDSIPAVEFHVSRIFSMPMRPTGL
ncbi:hypothetical protein ID866_2252 [Astraeus odoratus]|nr:hypothetical protein ID866_2252 [Astraeus odoratus]